MALVFFYLRGPWGWGWGEHMCYACVHVDMGAEILTRALMLACQALWPTEPSLPHEGFIVLKYLMVLVLFFESLPTPF